KPVEIPVARPRISQPIQREIVNELNTVDQVEEQVAPTYHDEEEEVRPAAKGNITDRIRGLFGSMFE
ncbi:cell division protein FtsA C-terminal domain-containing protein, partial [Streptococcus suis]